MNVTNTTAAASVPSTEGLDSKRAALQLALLKKSLDVQEQQAAQIMKQLEGKGQTIDLRV